MGVLTPFDLSVSVTLLYNKVQISSLLYRSNNKKYAPGSDSKRQKV